MMQIQNINEATKLLETNGIIFLEYDSYCKPFEMKIITCHNNLENKNIYHNNSSIQKITKKHCHEYIEIIYISKGIVEVNTYNESILLRTGEIIIIGGRLLHDVKALTSQGCYQCLHIKYDFLEEYFKCDDLAEKIFKVHDISNVLYFFKNFIFYLKKTDCVSQIKYKANILMLLAMILEDKNYNKDINIEESIEFNVTNNTINNILCYIKSKYREDITLNFIAEKFNYTPQNISILFKKNLGKTFHKYLTELRLENSMELLLNSNKKIVEIALESGFPNEMSFISKFKSKYNMTPNMYRKQNKIRK